MIADYIITKSYISSPFVTDRQATCWTRVKAVQRRKIAYCEKGDEQYETLYKPLTREQAQELIKKAGLVKVVDNKYGEIYDTPTKDFKFLYEHDIKITTN